MKAAKLLSLLAVSGFALHAGIASAADPKAAGGKVSGEKVFTASCAACHGSGVMGAPKLGDKAAWAPRIAQGKPTLYKHAMDGFKMMPARGGNPALKDAEIQAAIDYMVSKAG